MANSRLRVSIALALMTLLLSTGAACRKQTASNANSSAATNKSLPNTPPASAHGWTLANNQRMTLGNYQGKVVLLDFYATWCEPCRAETPHLVRLQQQYADQGLQIIGLNVGGEDDRAEVPAYAKEFGIQYPMGFPEDEFADDYLSDNQSIPQTFVFDRSGKLVKRFVGYSEDSGAEIESVIKSSLASSSP
jgi:cytochrome c biogenesis protein CcmG/thiol:disulfide interchange protein DsbE